MSAPSQAESGLGLEAQRARLEAEAERRGWTDVSYVVDDGYSGKNLNRPGISAVLEDLAAGPASVLAVAKLDRLTRSLSSFAALGERATREGWLLVVLDPPPT